ncbi:hypothetical protein ACA910_013468 [Epithemia clementina (nom. ined.)]
MSPTDLSRAIVNGQWTRAAQIAKDSPRQAEVWSRRDGFFDGSTPADVLPLHEALVANAPLECVVAIVEANPGALMKQESSYDRVPLHCACRKHVNPEVVEALAKRCTAACLEPDQLERLPIHYALSNGADPEVINILMKYGPSAARSYDHRGWSPVHVAVNLGASEQVVKSLLDAYPEVVLTRTNRGHSISRVIPKNAKNRRELAKLVSETKVTVEETIHLPLLRKKSLNPDHMTMI